MVSEWPFAIPKCVNADPVIPESSAEQEMEWFESARRAMCTDRCAPIIITKKMIFFKYFLMDSCRMRALMHMSSTHGKA